MVEACSSDTSNLNMTQIEQKELKPIDIVNIIRTRQESMRKLSQKITLHNSYYVPDKEYPESHCLPKILKQMPNESDASHSKRVKDYLLIITDE